MGYLFSLVCLVSYFMNNDSIVLLTAACFAIAGAIETKTLRLKNEIYLKENKTKKEEN